MQVFLLKCFILLLLMCYYFTAVTALYVVIDSTVTLFSTLTCYGTFLMFLVKLLMLFSPLLLILLYGFFSIFSFQFVDYVNILLSRWWHVPRKNVTKTDTYSGSYHIRTFFFPFTKICTSSRNNLRL